MPSTTNWHSLKGGRLSTTSSSLLLSTTFGNAVSNSWTRTLVVTRPHPRERSVLSRSQWRTAAVPISPGTSFAVVAKDVDGTATPAAVRGQRKRLVNAPQRDHTEQMRVNACDRAGWNCRQSTPAMSLLCDRTRARSAPDEQAHQHRWSSSVFGCFVVVGLQPFRDLL